MSAAPAWSATRSSRYKELLSDEQQELIRGECEDLYRQALAASGAGEESGANPGLAAG